MKPNHQTFIIEMMKHGDKALAYTKAYPNSKGGETARKGGRAPAEAQPRNSGRDRRSRGAYAPQRLYRSLPPACRAAESALAQHVEKAGDTGANSLPPGKGMPLCKR